MTNARKIKLCRTDKIGVNQLACFDVEGKSILVANIQGRFHAVSAMCTHEDYPLCHGGVKHGYIECSLHGSRFDLTTGAPLEAPATENLTVYPLSIEDDEVWVSI